MSTIALIILWILRIYQLVLLARVVLDFVQILARDWYPTGFLLVVVNFVYKLTDPPLRWLAKYIPPLRLGAVSLDMGFLVLFFGVQILMMIVSYFV